MRIRPRNKTGLDKRLKPDVNVLCKMTKMCKAGGVYLLLLFILPNLLFCARLGKPFQAGALAAAFSAGNTAANPCNNWV